MSEVGHLGQVTDTRLVEEEKNIDHNLQFPFCVTGGVVWAEVDNQGQGLAGVDGIGYLGGVTGGVVWAGVEHQGQGLAVHGMSSY